MVQDFVHQQYPIYKIISKEFLVKGLGSFAWENPPKKKNTAENSQKQQVVGGEMIYPPGKYDIPYQ